eukprot:1158040-Pelagomonas_calceolata.AAC.4
MSASAPSVMRQACALDTRCCAVPTTMFLRRSLASTRFSVVPTWWSMLLQKSFASTRCSVAPTTMFLQRSFASRMSSGNQQCPTCSILWHLATSCSKTLLSAWHSSNDFTWRENSKQGVNLKHYWRVEGN